MNKQEYEQQYREQKHPKQAYPFGLGNRVAVLEGAHKNDHGVIINEFEGKYILRLERGMIEILCYPHEIGIG